MKYEQYHSDSERTVKSCEDIGTYVGMFFKDIFFC